MSAIEKIVVGGKTYCVQELSVLDTIYFHAEAMHLLGDAVGKFLDVYVQAKNGGNIDLQELGKAFTAIDPEAIRILQPKILRQVATPENKFLDNEMAVEAWFSQPDNAGYVWELTIKAGGILLGKYLPRFLKEMVDAMKAAATTMTKSPSQTNTEPKP